MCDERTTQYDYYTNHEREKNVEQNNGAEENKNAHDTDADNNHTRPREMTRQTLKHQLLNPFRRLNKTKNANVSG